MPGGQGSLDTQVRAPRRLRPLRQAVLLHRPHVRSHAHSRVHVQRKHHLIVAADDDDNDKQHRQPDRHSHAHLRVHTGHCAQALRLVVSQRKDVLLFLVFRIAIEWRQQSASQRMALVQTTCRRPQQSQQQQQLL